MKLLKVIFFVLLIVSCQSIQLGKSTLTISRDNLCKYRNLAVFFFTNTNCLPCIANLKEQLNQDSFTIDNTSISIVYMGAINKMERVKIDGHLDNYFKGYKMIRKNFKFNYGPIRFITGKVEYNTFIDEGDFEKTPFVQLLSGNEMSTYVAK